MKTLFGTPFLYLPFLMCICSIACSNTPGQPVQQVQQSPPQKTEPVFEAEPDANLDLTWSIIHDSSRPASTFKAFAKDYTANKNNITAFRGDPTRNNPSRGRIESAPKGLKLDWTFITRTDAIQKGNDGSKYSKINWGGGSGWTGQPLVVQWPRQMKEALQINDKNFVQNDAAKEVVVGSLSGEIYFINFENGQATREAWMIDGPIKGTVSVDPRLNGMLYVGQGIPKIGRFGAYGIDMVKRKVNFFQTGLDADAARKWGAFDSNSLLDSSSGTLFWPGENGLIYKINVQDKDNPFVQTKLKYNRKGMGRLGLEASMAAIGSYGYFGDNSGNVFCVDLRTMQPVWQIDNQDDTDASLVVDKEEDNYYLYVGNEVDHRQPQALSSLKKIDARNGKLIWEVTRNCSGSPVNDKDNSGGILATPLVGKEKGEHIAIAIFSRPDKSMKSELVAVDKRTGKELYSFRLNNYTWATPTDFYDKEGNMYLFFSDVSGGLYILNGMTGKLIHQSSSGYVMESSPVIIGDRIVVGTRGNKIVSYKLLTN